MTQGRFLMDRGVFDNALWLDPVGFRVFFYLVGHAAFRDGVKAGTVTLKRGQYLRSLRNLQRDLEWKEGKATKSYSMGVLHRAIGRLVEYSRIQTMGVDGGTLFTVLNYAQYQTFQDVQNERWSNSGTAAEQEEQMLTNEDQIFDQDDVFFDVPAQTNGLKIWAGYFQSKGTANPYPMLQGLINRHGTVSVEQAMGVVIQKNPDKPAAYLHAVLKNQTSAGQKESRPLAPLVEHKPWLSLRECGCAECWLEMKRLRGLELAATGI